MSTLTRDKSAKRPAPFTVVKKTTTTTSTNQDGDDDDDVTAVKSMRLQQSTRRRERPSSPVVSARIDEKNQLAALNDRLAAYIERARRLESESEQLNKITAEIEETIRRERNGVKLLYDAEISEARRLLDQMATEKAKYQLEACRFESELNDLKPKLVIKERAESDLKQKLILSESEIGKLQSRLHDLSAQRRQIETANVGLSEELANCTKDLTTAKKNLEEEIIRRIDLENCNKTLEEEKAFQTQVHRKELDALTSQRRIELEQVDIQIQQEYNRLSEALHQMREENDEQIRRSRTEIEAIYDSKLADSQESMKKFEESAVRMESDLRRAQQQCEELTVENSRLNSLVRASSSQIDNLQRLLRQERGEHQNSVAGKNAEIEQLKKAIDDQLAEYRDLLGIKIQLDSEIATYRKLLELEESRLNASTSKTKPNASTKSDREIRLRGRNISGSSRNPPITTIVEHSDVEIESVDPQGRYVRLLNTTNKTINIKGWALRQTSGNEEITFEFPPRTFMKAHEALTIHSSGTTERSLSRGGMEITMPYQTWLKNNAVETKLTDSKGEEVSNQSATLHHLPSPSATSLLSDDGTSLDDHQDSGVEISRSSGWSFGPLFTFFM